MTAPVSVGPVCLLLRDLANGGVEKVTLNLAEGLVSLGWPVDLVLFERSGALVHHVPEGVDVFDLGGPSSLAISPLRGSLSLFRAFSRYLERRCPAVVVSSKEQANLLAMVSRISPGTSAPVILVRHVPLDPAVVGRESRWIVRALYRTLFRRGDAFVGVSRGIASEIGRRVGRRAADRVWTIPNPVLTPRIDWLAQAPPPPELAPLFDRQGPVVLAIGRLDEQKGFDLLIRAFSRVDCAPMPHLLILGEGLLRNELEALVRDLGLTDRVTMAGHIENPYSVMKRSALFVLSSRWEGMPTVLVEAAYLGLPIVASDCPTGPAELLQEGRLGRLVRAGDDLAFANAIGDALREPVRPSIRQDELNRFSIPSASNDYHRLIESLARRKG